MVRARLEMQWPLAIALAVCLVAPARPQEAGANSFDRSGQASVDGRTAPYLIRRLPVDAFPQLPVSVQSALLRRGCLIPQSYEARHPENVVHASLERPGSSDWAALCSASGTVSLLVFFPGRAEPMVLATAPETSRLEAHGISPVLGFNWVIDPASPEDVHEAQLGMNSPPPRLDHDALADSVTDGKTTYRFYTGSVWTVVDTRD